METPNGFLRSPFPDCAAWIWLSFIGVENPGLRALYFALAAMIRRSGYQNYVFEMMPELSSKTRAHDPAATLT
jgi:hypothetical protein